MSVLVAFSVTPLGASPRSLGDTVCQNDVPFLSTFPYAAPPHDGVLNTIGFLGGNIGELGGFDISGATGSAFVAVRDIGLSTSTFWSIDLTTGQAMMVGQIGGGEIITAMALRNVPTPATATLLGLGLLGVGRRRR